jgi:hypothetical protein
VTPTPIGKLADVPASPLTFSVDYWDYLGWTDTFASRSSPERQKAYVPASSCASPIRPRWWSTAEEAQGLKTARSSALSARPLRSRAIRRTSASSTAARRRRLRPRRARRRRGLADALRPAHGRGAVKAGDNRGETVVQQNVVRQIPSWAWRGRPQAYRLPPGARR